jgi:hypothetical protein
VSKPADCHLCGRFLPLGGVSDDVGRPCHYVCRQLAKSDVAEQARATAKRVAREGKPRQTALPRTA